jgi:flagellar biosynthesis/type III secretory pathway chaperone
VSAEAHSQATADLRAMLAAGLDAAGRFEALLAEERQALETRDSAALAALATRKQAAVSELESIEARRVRALKQAAIPNDAAGMQRLLASADDQQRWQDYLDLAGRCQQANMTNGAVIRLRHQQIADALAVLSGDRRETYGPNGSGRPANSRALAEA